MSPAFSAALTALSTSTSNAAAAAGATSTGLETGETTLALIRLFVVLVGVAALVTLLARRINLPYTVALVAIGILAGAVFTPLHLQITPELVLVVLVPALIFDAAYRIDFEKLRPSLLGVSLLAGPGVLVTAVLVAVFLHYGAGLAPAPAFIVGAMLAATDPAAVIATFKRLSSPRRLATLIEAESLFNDGTGIVAFTLAVGFATSAASPLEVGFEFVSVVVISAAIGAATGWIASRILPNVGDHLIEISLSVVLAYGTYLAADAMHQSGVIATATAAMVLGNYGRSQGMSNRTEEALDTVWEFVAFLATAFVFLVVGFAIPLRSLEGVVVSIGWAIAACFAARAVIVYGFVGGLRWWRRWVATRRMAPEAYGGADAASPAEPSDDAEAEADDDRERRGRRQPNEGDMPFSWLHVIYWSGLRGAVSTALALSLPVDMPNRSELQAITFGVVLFTLLAQATTAELVVDRWGQKDRGAVIGRAPRAEKPARVEKALKPKVEKAGKTGKARKAAIEPAKADGPRSVEPAKADGPRSVEPAKADGPRSIEPAKSAPAAAEADSTP